jgi:hypothetical protein
MFVLHLVEKIEFSIKMMPLWPGVNVTYVCMVTNLSNCCQFLAEKMAAFFLKTTFLGADILEILTNIGARK